MKQRTLAYLVGALLALPAAIPLANAHQEHAPNLNCEPAQEVHDWVLAGSSTATALQETSGAGATIVFESSINCPLVPLICEEDIVVDDGGTPEDPSDDIVIPCDPPLNVPLVPGSDGDFEWGVGGALLPDDHHTGDAGTVAVTCDPLVSESIINTNLPDLPCAWTAGRDGDDDGTVDGGDDPDDCLSNPITTSTPAPGSTSITDATDSRPCDDANAGGGLGGLDTGTWIFISTNVNTGDDGSLVNNCGPILTVDIDPNGDLDPTDSTVTVNPLWIPGPPGPTGCLTVNPPTGAPSPDAQVAIWGHAANTRAEIDAADGAPCSLPPSGNEVVVVSVELLRNANGDIVGAKVTLKVDGVTVVVCVTLPVPIPAPTTPNGVHATVSVNGTTITIEIWLETNGQPGLQRGGPNPDTHVATIIVP